MTLINKNRRYLDSAFDQSATALSIDTRTDRFAGLVQPTTGLGEAARIAQDGFRLADTPQCCVFIEKKQWADETWTYVVESSPVNTAQSLLENAKAELSRLRAEQQALVRQTNSFDIDIAAKITAAETKIKQRSEELEAARKAASTAGGQDQVDGKLFQMAIRRALGNIITRKLDWMNDHEKFTKVTSAVNEVIRDVKIGANLIGPLSKEKNRLQAAKVKAAQINAQQTAEAGTANQIGTIDAHIAQLQQQNIVFQQGIDANVGFVGPLAEGQTTPELEERIRINLDRIARLENRKKDVVTDALRNGNLQQELEDLISFEFAPVTLSGNAFTRYYRAPKYKTVDTEEATKLKERQKTLLEKQVILQEQINSQTDTSVLSDLRRQHADIKKELDKIRDDLAVEQLLSRKEPDASGEQEFNGIIELANVPSVNTQISLDGEGTATFTIENPQNIFYIGNDDITLALSQNPMEEARNQELLKISGSKTNVGDLTYFRGRWYPKRIIEMLTRGKGSAIDIGHLTQGTATANRQRALTNDLDALDQQLTAILQQIGEAQNASVAQKVIDDLEIQRTAIQDKIQRLRNDDTALKQELEKEQHLFASVLEVLKKYYLGKTIFEVLDRVYIWMTTPTRTLFRVRRPPSKLTNTSEFPFAIEDPSVIAQAQQLAATEQEIEVVENKLKNLRRAFADTTEAKTDKEIIELDVNASDISYLTLNVEGEGPLQIIEAKNDKNKGFISLLSKLSELESVREFMKKQLASTDSQTGARTFDKITSRGEFADASAEGEYESRFSGIEEQRLQVFQGIVSSVSQSYSDGKYQIQVSCKDNLTFLSISRIMIKPALRTDREPVGILENPIWRSGPNAGSWKNGILVLDHAFINDEVAAKINKRLAIGASNPYQTALDTKNKNPLPDTEGRQAVAPFTTSLPFARIDAADLVSFIITGVPYSFELFVKNAVFGGRLFSTQGETDQRNNENSFFGFLKRSIGEQNDRLGDFEPYINVGHFTAETLEQKHKDLIRSETSAIFNLTVAYTTFVLTRLRSYITNAAKSSPAIVAPAQKEALAALLVWEQLVNAVLVAARSSENAIISRLINIVIASARAGSDEQAGTKTVALPETPETSKEIKSIVDSLLKTPSSRVDTGLFDKVVRIIEKKSKDDVAQTNAGLTSFIRKLLELDDSYRNEYREAMRNINALKNFDNILPVLKDFVADSKRVSAVQKISANSLDSTIERVIRQEKRNFLVISDRYQLDNSLQAYQTEVAGGDFALFQSEFETPLSICKRAADQVDFEFFADSQGNIQFRPPTYNRILKEHFGLISDTDGPVRDAILVQFGSSQGLILQAIYKSIALVSQAILEYVQKREGLLAQLKEKRQSILSALSTGNLDDINLVQVLGSKDTLQAGVVQSREAELKEEVLKGKIERANNGKVDISFTFAVTVTERVKKIIEDIRLKEQMFLATTARVQLEAENNARQELKDAQEEFQNAADANKATKKVLFQKAANEYAKVFGEAEILKLLQQIPLYGSFIEDLSTLSNNLVAAKETAANGAERFVDSLKALSDEHRIHRIADHDLMSYNLTEAPPRFTRLDVIGSPDLVPIQVGSTGNEFYWSGGVDYDMWRNYGFMAESIQKAYFHSGDAAKVYCRALLARERGRIFSGSITVRGDAKYRLGDCVFLETQGMYYYVMGISNEFQYGQSYQTSLTLGYGRRIGELIPHPFDVLGGIMIEAYQSDNELNLARESLAAHNKERQELESFVTKLGVKLVP